MRGQARASGTHHASVGCNGVSRWQDDCVVPLYADGAVAEVVRVALVPHWATNNPPCTLN